MLGQLFRLPARFCRTVWVFCLPCSQAFVWRWLCHLGCVPISWHVRTRQMPRGLSPSNGPSVCLQSSPCSKCGCEHLLQAVHRCSRGPLLHFCKICQVLTYIYYITVSFQCQYSQSYRQNKKTSSMSRCLFLFCKITFLLSKFDVNHALLQRLGEFSTHVSKQRSRWVEGGTTRGNDGQ